MNSSQTYEVQLTTFAHGGEAIGRLPDGRAVFVPYAIPGESVSVRLIEEKRGYARAGVPQILSTSPERIPARCPHFTECGGCHYQHMTYSSQLKAKRNVLCDQLERIGKLQNPSVETTIPSKSQWNYRNHIQLDITEKGDLGYHRPRSNDVIAIDECHLPDPTIQSILSQIDIGSLPGLEQVGLRVGSDDKLMLVLKSHSDQAPEFSIERLPLSAVFLGPRGDFVLAGSSHIHIKILERVFQVSSSSFFQINNDITGSIVNHLLQHLPLDDDTTLLDVYCGVGLFSAFLADKVKHLIGVEAMTTACDDFLTNLDEYQNVDLIEGKAEDVLHDLDIQPDIILVDPPRTGLHRKVLDSIADLQPSTLAYVSCDPATLARDSHRLSKKGYHPTLITPFDLFPQTYHIESVSFWEKD